MEKKGGRAAYEKRKSPRPYQDVEHAVPPDFAEALASHTLCAERENAPQTRNGGRRQSILGARETRILFSSAARGGLRAFCFTGSHQKPPALCERRVRLLIPVVAFHT